MKPDYNQAWSLISTPLRFAEVAAPSAGQIGPNTLALYAKDKAGTSRLYYKDDAGTEHEIPGIGTGGAPDNADYLVKTANASLSAERVVTDTTSIVWDWGTAGQAKATRAALTGDVTASADSNATTIANDAVTNAKLANMVAWSVKLRNNAASGDATDAIYTDLTTATPASGDWVLGFLSTGEIRKYDVDGLLGGGSGSGGEPVTNGDADNPEIVFDTTGDLVMTP